MGARQTQAALLAAALLLAGCSSVDATEDKKSGCGGGGAVQHQFCPAANTQRDKSRGRLQRERGTSWLTGEDGPVQGARERRAARQANMGLHEYRCASGTLTKRKCGGLTPLEIGVDAWAEAHPPGESGEPGSTWCRDVTSFDYDWDNDMECHRPDGSVFYTDYAGARAFLNH